MQWQSLGDGTFSVDESTATFEGTVPADGAEGAPRVRVAIEAENLNRFEGLAIRAEGGGVPFELCLETTDDGAGGRYCARFDAPNEFRQIRIPFASVEADGAPPLDPDRIARIGFSAAPEHAGPFCLRIEWVRAYGYGGPRSAR